MKDFIAIDFETANECPSSSRIENLGKYFLDKHTGQVSLVTYHRGDPVRWNVLRENVPED